MEGTHDRSSTAGVLGNLRSLPKDAGAQVLIHGAKGVKHPPQRMPPLPTPLRNQRFNLNTAGVAGFFGGEEAISAMATVHLYKGRRWLGWFNSPGSYTVAKRFGRIANSRFWDGLFPGSNDSPAVSFDLDGQKGPLYIAALSGTTIKETGHLGHLTMERSKRKKEHGKKVEVDVIQGRTTTPVRVAYLAMKPVDNNSPVKQLPIKSALLGLIPIVVSVVTCIMCALVYDWLSFSMILIGIISSGCASFFIGKGRLTIEFVKKPATGVPPGHGILIGEDGVVVIKGEERDVNAITKGRFVLETNPKEGDKGEKQGTDGKKLGEEKEAEECRYHAIGVCSLVLLLQFLLQLLLVPQGTLFGQIMFLVSLGFSWGYNSYLSSLDKERIQINILFQALGEPNMVRFRTGTRTMMAVFVCLLLFHGVECSNPEKGRAFRTKILNDCVPNDTDDWKRWKEAVVEQLLHVDDESFLHLVEKQGDSDLVKQLLEDARAAFRGYFRVQDNLPDDSSHQVEA